MKKFIYGFLALFTMMSIVPTVSIAGNETTTSNENSKTYGADGGAESRRGGTFSAEANTTDFTNASAHGMGGHSTTEGAKILDSIQKFINWALGMLATVALVLCLWGGFKMMTAGGDDGKYTEGTNILKKAAIGLVVIGGAWMIVSVVMWLIGKVS